MAIQQYNGDVVPGTWCPMDSQELMEIGHGSFRLGHPGYLAWVKSEVTTIDALLSEEDKPADNQDDSNPFHFNACKIVIKCLLDQDRTMSDEKREQHRNARHQAAHCSQDLPPTDLTDVTYIDLLIDVLERTSAATLDEVEQYKKWQRQYCNLGRLSVSTCGFQAFLSLCKVEPEQLVAETDNVHLVDFFKLVLHVTQETWEEEKANMANIKEAFRAVALRQFLMDIAIYPSPTPTTTSTEQFLLCYGCSISEAHYKYNSARPDAGNRFQIPLNDNHVLLDRLAMTNFSYDDVLEFLSEHAILEPSGRSQLALTKLKTLITVWAELFAAGKLEQAADDCPLIPNLGEDYHEYLKSMVHRRDDYSRLGDKMIEMFFAMGVGYEDTLDEYFDKIPKWMPMSSMNEDTRLLFRMLDSSIQSEAEWVTHPCSGYFPRMLYCLVRVAKANYEQDEMPWGYARIGISISDYLTGQEIKLMQCWYKDNEDMAFSCGIETILDALKYKAIYQADYCRDPITGATLDPSDSEWPLTTNDVLMRQADWQRV